MTEATQDTAIPKARISQAIAYGDDRPYVVALLTVDGPKLLAFAAARGIHKNFAAIESLYAAASELAAS